MAGLPDQPDEEAIRSAIASLVGALPDTSAEGIGRLGSLVEAAQALGDRMLEAHAIYHLGRAGLEVGAFTEASNHLDVAREIYHEQGDQLAVLNVSLGDIARHVMTGDPRAAVEVGNRAIDELTAIVETESDPNRHREAVDLLHRMRSNHVLGLVAAGEFETAIEHSDACLEYAESNSPPGHQALVLSNRGHLLVEMGKPRIGLIWTERATEIFERLDLSERAARCHAISARAHAQLGHFGTSLDLLTRAERAMSDLPDAANRHTIRIEIARVYSMIGRARDALDILEVLLPRLEGSANLSDRITGLLLAAELTARSDDEQARVMFLDAHDLLRSAGHERDAARAMVSLAESLSDLNRADRELVVDSLAQLEVTGTPFDRVRCQLVAVEAGLCPLDTSVRQVLDDAELLSRQFAAPHLQWRLAHQRGLLEIRANDLVAARAALSEATEILHRLRSTIPDEWLRTLFLADKRGAVDSLRSVLLELDLPDELIELLDRSYGITLGERVTQELRGDAMETGAELSVLYDEMVHADQRRLRSMQGRVSELEQTMASLAGPRGWPSREEPTIEAEPSVAATSIVVTYGESGDEVFAVVAAPDQPARLVRHLTSIEALTNRRIDLAIHRRRLATRSLSPSQAILTDLTVRLLQDFFDVLLRPLELPVGEPLDRLVIVPPPSGVDLPFAAMHDGRRHLTETFVVTMAPSPSVADAMSVRQQSWRRSRGDDRSAERRTVAVGVGAADIPHSVLEASEIANRTGGRALLGEAATVERFCEYLSDCDTIHLAAHSLSRSTDPWFSGFQLADRWVTAAEVSGWQLEGQLVVLSGCATGLQTDAEAGTKSTSLEMLGLPRAFLAAGASGVIVTLSDLDDAEAVMFMRPLHDHLRHLAPDEAVRRTQCDLLRSGMALGTWSSIAYIGGPSPRF